MRSGSTLLKALLAEADDVSNLPESNFQKFSGKSNARPLIELLADESIILMKRPAWYTECRSYPRLPDVSHLKIILLTRDVYDTVQSCRKMTFWKAQGLASSFADHWLVNRYWCSITKSLLRCFEDESLDTTLIRYEDLTEQPIEETRRLFQFIGSQQAEGVDTYSPPENFKWRWGRDDGSSNIRSLKVQPSNNKPKDNQRLWEIIENSSEVMELRKELKYC